MDKGERMKEPTFVLPKGGRMLGTWHPSIFESPFEILFVSKSVAGRNYYAPTAGGSLHYPDIRLSMSRGARGGYGFYVDVLKVRDCSLAIFFCVRIDQSDPPWQNAWTDAQNGIFVVFRVTIFGDSPNQPNIYKTTIKDITVRDVFILNTAMRTAHALDRGRNHGASATCSKSATSKPGSPSLCASASEIPTRV
jgi:hypothetical protein